MQIHYSSLKFCDEHDEDTTIIVNKYFIRARGFTAWEIITAAKNHQIFDDFLTGTNRVDWTIRDAGGPGRSRAAAAASNGECLACDRVGLCD